jgi:hypothetical protein
VLRQYITQRSKVRTTTLNGILTIFTGGEEHGEHVLFWNGIIPDRACNTQGFSRDAQLQATVNCSWICTLHDVIVNTKPSQNSALTQMFKQRTNCLRKWLLKILKTITI